MLKYCLQTAIKGYQWTLSPFLGRRCRFYPSCSEYALLSLDQFPVHRALNKTVQRLLRCHPWHPGGVDFP